MTSLRLAFTPSWSGKWCRSPCYAWKPDGNPTKQLFDGVMGMTDRTTVNGVVTDFSQVGVNVVGIIIVTWAARSRERLDLWRRRSVVSAAV